MQEETVEKSCDACGAANAPHALRHLVRRLPRVLALHLKRFKVVAGPAGAPVGQKLQAPVGVAETLRLAPYLAQRAMPPLPPPPGAAGKENQGGLGNQQHRGEQQQQGGHQGASAKLAGQLLKPRTQTNFYSGGAMGASPVAIGALLSPPPASALRSPGSFLHKRPISGGSDGTAGWGGSSGREEESDLQQALELSALEYEQQQQQPQEQEKPAAAAAGEGRAGRPQGRAGRPPDHAAAASLDAASVEDVEDADLQEALALSLLEQRQGEAGLGPAVFAGRQPAAEQADVVDMVSGEPSDVAAGPGSGGQAGGESLQQQAQEGGHRATGPPPEIVEDDWMPAGVAGTMAAAHAGRARLAAGRPAAAEAAKPGAGPAGMVASQSQYSLQAVVSHRGASASSGHFTADTRDAGGGGGQWLRYNDSLVTRIGRAEATGAAAQRDCYLLFYVSPQHQ